MAQKGPLSQLISMFLCGEREAIFFLLLRLEMFKMWRPSVKLPDTTNLLSPHISLIALAVW